MSGRRVILLIAVLALLGGLLPASALADHAASQSNPWPVDGANSANTRQATVVGPAEPSVRWSADLDDYAIGGIIGGTAGGGGRAVSDNDGNLLLRASLRETHPAYAGGARYVLASIDRTDGSVRWEAFDTMTRDAHSSCVPAVAPDGTIYATVKAGDSGVAVRLVGLDPDTGQELGQGVDVGRNCTGSLQFAHDGRLLYAEQGTTFGATDGVHRLRAFTVSGGSITPSWDRVNRIPSNDADAPYRATSRPVFADAGTAGAGAFYWVEYLSNEGPRDLKLRKLDAASGGIVAEVDIPGQTVRSLHADPDGGVIVSTTPHSGSEFAGHLYRYVDQGNSLVEDWSHDIVQSTQTDRLRSPISPTMVLAGDHLVAWYTNRDFIFALDWRSGEHRWEFTPPGSGGFSGANNVMTADAGGNAYYERFGGPRMGSVTADGTLRGELSEAPFSGRVGYLGPFTDEGDLYVFNNNASVALLAGEQQAERIAGSNRFETAALLSARTFSPGIDVAYVATGFGFADALTGGVAAALDDAPMLLVATDSIPAATRSELTRLDPRRIRILGGETVVNSAVENELAGLARDGAAGVERLFGSDRFGTARAISQATFPDGADTVYIGTGLNFPDAVTAAPAAASVPGPVLLVRPDSVPGPTGTELARLDPENIVVIGGRSVISDEVVNLMLAGYGNTQRISGADRYETGARLTAHAFPDASAVDTVFIATGNDYPDALSAGAVAGAVPAPVLLVHPDRIPASTAAQLERLGPSNIKILGGTRWISAEMARELSGYMQ